MSNPITNVSLSFCCQENWNDFEAITERERFCASCKHRVVDFTSATADDLKLAKKQSGSICGRFTRSQMSAAFLIGLTASSVLSGCSEPDLISKTEEPAAVAPVEVEETTLKSEEFFTVGMVVMEPGEVEADSLAARIREDVEKLSE
jgi:hypothetical protein